MLTVADQKLQKNLDRNFFNIQLKCVNHSGVSESLVWESHDFLQHNFTVYRNKWAP